MYVWKYILWCFPCLVVGCCLCFALFCFALICCFILQDIIFNSTSPLQIFLCAKIHMQPVAILPFFYQYVQQTNYRCPDKLSCLAKSKRLSLLEYSHQFERQAPKHQGRFHILRWAQPGERISGMFSFLSIWLMSMLHNTTQVHFQEAICLHPL